MVFSSVAGAQPANDNCSDATALPEGTNPFSNIGATTDGPPWCGSPGADVWYTYSAAASGVVTLELLGDGGFSDFPVLAVYDGCSCPAGELVDCRTTYWQGDSRITFNARGGTCYLIQAAGSFGIQGTGTISLTVEPGSTTYVDGDVWVSGDGSTWSQAKKTISEALTPANYGDEIWVAEGTYMESIRMATSGVGLYGGFAGTETERSQRDFIAHPVTIDGSTARAGLPANNVVAMTDISDATLDGFVVTGGRADFHGGGIICLHADDSCTIENCTITENAALEKGGGVYFNGSAAKLINCTIAVNSATEGGGIHFDMELDSATLMNCTVSVNSATDRGGGICCAYSSPQITNCTIGSNSAPTGGGIACLFLSPTITDCTIADNSGRLGAGIYHYECSSSLVGCIIDGNSATQWGGGFYMSRSDPTMAGCAVTRNAAGWDGGGIECYMSSPVMPNCEIMGNSAAVDGGGMDCYAGSSPVLTSCIIAGNSSNRNGGGIYCEFQSSPEITGCTVSSNFAAQDGGGICCWSITSPTMTNCVISGNRAATHGGGIGAFDDASPLMMNCAISGNSANGYGGGVWYWDARGKMVNCTLSGNSASWSGGGVTCMVNSDVEISNTIFEDNRKRAIYEEDAGSDPTVLHCLFHNNPNGDYYDEGSTPYDGAPAINTNIPEATGNVEGDPEFLPSTSGVWTATPTYDAITKRTTLISAFGTFPPNSLTGRTINPNVAQRRQALILANTATTVGVAGDVTGFVAEGSQYALVDYHLGCGSAAIDEGTSEGAPATDLDGTARPVDVPGHGAEGTGSEYDIGAYEFAAITSPEITVLVSGGVLDFGSQHTDAGQTASQYATIVNDGFADLHFTGGGLEITGTEAGQFVLAGTPDMSPIIPGGTRTVSVAFDPSATGLLMTHLAITTDDPDEPVVLVGLMGNGTGQEVDVAPVALDFGIHAIDQGPSASQPVAIENQGTDILNFTGDGIGITGSGSDHFTITGVLDTSPIPSSGLRTVDVAFDPSAIGPCSAALTITTDDADEPIVNVSLTGTGSSFVPTPTLSTTADRWQSYR